MVEPKVLKKLSKITTVRILEKNKGKKLQRAKNGKMWKNMKICPPITSPLYLFLLILRVLFLDNLFYNFDLAIWFYHKYVIGGNLCFLNSLGFFKKSLNLK
jgi:hypothetical protein